MDYENLLKVIKQRRSIRKYKSEPVPIDIVMKVLEAARWAPSGRNSQPWEFIVVRSEDKLRLVKDIMLEKGKRMADTTANFSSVKMDFLEDVTTFVIVCADPRFKVAYPQSQVNEQLATMYLENSERILIQSIAAAVNNMLLAACSLGLGAVWLTGAGESITEQQLKETFQIPQELRTICCIPLGYTPIKQLSPRQPRPLEDIVHFDEFDATRLRSDQYVEKYAHDQLLRARFRGTGLVE